MAASATVPDPLPVPIIGSAGPELAGTVERVDAWKVEDQQPAIMTADDIAEYIGDAPKVCARIADGGHGLVPDATGGFHTGNCLPIPR